MSDQMSPAKPEMSRVSPKLRGFVELAALGAGFGTLAGFLGRFWWVLDLFSHFRWQYLWVLAGSAVIFLMLRRRWWFAVCALGCAVNVALIAPLYAPARTSPRLGGGGLDLLHLNVLTSNLRYGSTCRYLEQSGAEIIFLQEVNARWLEEIKAGVRGYNIAFAEPRRDNFGIAVLTAIETLEPFDPMNLKTVDGPVAPKDVQSVAISLASAGVPAVSLSMTWEQRPLRILSLHTLPPVGRQYATIRDQQLAAAGRWALAQEDPVVIIGDLNATPWSHGFKQLIHETGLENSQVGYGLGATFPARWPLIPIDHCLHSPDLVTADRFVGPDLGSDHRPVKITLHWSN